MKKNTQINIMTALIALAFMGFIGGQFYCTYALYIAASDENGRTP